ncbi:MULTISPECIES: DUF397 domain-containing protein [Streptomyces]|uniref:DUF397 domain-containing protein n=1 Tax=Streptomyces TaxID=1883 RepID=UPI0012FEB4E4|nr:MULTISPECIES: DUF397 domain-containing protein [Streptomyces]
MSELIWIKSSFSEASGNACVEVAVCDGAAVAIRDSVQPARSIRASRAALDALITGLRTGALDNPRG